MKTEKLFEQDAFLKEFSARVLSCRRQGKYFAAVLDKTAFFPEGGGQPADTGTLGGRQVYDVQEKGGVIYHYLSEPLSGEVFGVLDWQTRFSRMQNHSGEHVVSGLIHRHTGADNISFTLTDEETTLAFNVPLNKALLQTVEQQANEAVFADVPIVAAYPDEAQLQHITYRSKLDLSENVRIVTIEGIDVCACCAPHCRSTGQIGLIKIVRSQPYKGGTKVWIACGSRALAHYGLLLQQTEHISHLLCAKQGAIDVAVERLKQAKEQADYQLVGMRRKAVEQAAAAVKAQAGNYVALCDFTGDDLRLFAEALKPKVAGIVVALQGDDAGGYRYVITARNVSIDTPVAQANAALGGRGGGRDNMARGSFKANLQEIEAFFNQNGSL